MDKTVLLVSLQKDLDVIGLKTLHYYLLGHSYHSHLLFMPGCDDHVTADQSYTAICDFVNQVSPLFIGLSLMSVEYQRAVDLSRVLKAHSSTIPIVWGGIHPTVAPETCLADADFVCIGEGEHAILDLANALSDGGDPRKVNNLCFREGERIVRNPLYPLIRDISKVSRYEHVPRNSFVYDNGVVQPVNISTFRKYARHTGITYSIMTSRGCPFSCTYCCNNAYRAIYGPRLVRFRQIPEFIDELKQAVTDHPFIEYINFQDDCFLARKDSDMRSLSDSYRKEVGRPFVVNSTPTYVTEDKIACLKSAGLAWVQLGLQSGSDRVCTEIYKRRSLRADFLRAARITKKYDIATMYDVILDNPFETELDQLETVQTVIDAPKPFYAHLFSLSLFPGTELRDRALQEGMIKGDEYQTKDYLLYTKTTVNNLVRLATITPAIWMRYLLALYRRNKQNSLLFRANMAIARLLGIVLFEPLTSMHVLWLSQRRSVRGTLRVMQPLLKEGLARFRKQFG